VLESIQYCFDAFVEDWVLVQDSDAIFNKMWLAVLKSLMSAIEFPLYALTLWKHPNDVIGEHKGLDRLPMVNGLNLLINRNIFKLLDYKSGFWDAAFSKLCWNRDFPIFRTRVSFVKHIGLVGCNNIFWGESNLDFAEQ